MKKSKEETVVLTLGVGATAKSAGSFGPFGLVTLQKMKTAGKVGSKVDDKDLVGPSVRVLFATPASIEALIAELKPVARKMRAFEKSILRAAKKLKKKPLEINFNAPTNQPTRHTNKRQPASRTRTKR